MPTARRGGAPRCMLSYHRLGERGEALRLRTTAAILLKSSAPILGLRPSRCSRRSSAAKTSTTGARDVVHGPRTPISSAVAESWASCSSCGRPRAVASAPARSSSVTAASQVATGGRGGRRGPHDERQRPPSPLLRPSDRSSSNRSSTSFVRPWRRSPCGHSARDRRTRSLTTLVPELAAITGFEGRSVVASEIERRQTFEAVPSS